MGQIPWQVVAFVLASGAPPVVVPLGPAARIDPLVAAWREEAGAKPPAVRTAERSAEGRSRAAGEQLRRLVWDPVVKHLAGAKRTFVVPDGSLHFVNVAALPTTAGHYLVETGPLIHYLSTERDLVREAPSGLGASTLIAFGGADFDRAPTDTEEVVRLAQAAVPTLLAPASTSVYRGPRAACESFRSLRFEALPASRTEVDQVAALWSADPRSTRSALELTGPTAHEALFKELAPKNRIVHLATHGFFLDPKCLEAGATASPLLSSGLALAGANHRDDAGPDEEDGILTAEEIASLDLSGVDWVVLSACSTGVGQPTNGEGVLGLRRAFEMAGAGTLIMSLWPVQDEASRAWMRALYEERLNGSTTADAVRQASLHTLEERRRAGLSTHPFYWGAFVAAGEWR
jgi:CHAT domain-containing protein